MTCKNGMLPLDPPVSSFRFAMSSCGTEELDGSCFPSSCCSTVQITFSDEKFLELYFGSTSPISALFEPHPTSPVLDFREVYMWKVSRFCKKGVLERYRTSFKRKMKRSCSVCGTLSARGGLVVAPALEQAATASRLRTMLTGGV